MRLAKLKACLKSNTDIMKLAGLTWWDFPSVKLTDSQWFGLRLLCDTLQAVNEEIELLREQYAGDKGVERLMEMFDEETVYYTLLNKEIGYCVGYTCTLAGYAHALKAASILLKELTE